MSKPASVSIDPNSTYTKSEYARAFGLNRVTLDKAIREKTVKTLSIRGCVLVLAERG